MANGYLQYIIILSLISISFQDVTNNKVDSKEESPLADVANEILKEKNLENIGGMVSSFLQSDGGKQIVGGLLQNIGSGQNVGQLLEGLGGLLNSPGSEEGTPKSTNQASKEQKINEGPSPIELLSGLGSLVGALQGGNGDAGGNPAALLQGLGTLLAGGNNQGGNNAATLIQSLGSLLGNAAQENNNENENKDNVGVLLQGLGSVIAAAAAANNPREGDNNLGILEGLGSLLGGGQDGSRGFNAEMVGNLIDAFAGSQSNEKNEVKPTKSKKTAHAKPKSKTKKVKKQSSNEFDLSYIINMASSFLSQGTNKDKASEGSSFMDYLPMILNTINAFSGPEAQERADSHSSHAGTIPSIFEKFHLFFDNFLHSDMAKQVLSYIGDEKTFKVFQDKKGNFSYQKFEELIENHSFRKHWIRQVTRKLSEFLKVIADEKTQNEYILTGLAFANSFLKSNGFPTSALINVKDPVRSITNFVNYAAKKYLDADNVDSKEYVKPAVMYVQGLIKMAKQSIVVNEESKELTETLTDTINMEIIEPITRVNRAYRFVKSQPKCDRYVFCLINQHVSTSSTNLPGLKKVLSKGSSLVAGWFLSSHTGTSYWSLYSDITEDKNCQQLYHQKCEGFHEEEIKVTTEYVHIEL